MGKYFYTDEFVQINSRNFLPVPLYINKERGSYMEEFADYVGQRQYFSRFREIPFVNLRLLVGNPRSAACDTPDDFKITSLGSRQRDFILDGPNFLFKQLAVLFYARNENIIKNSRLPWFVPTKYGGLGLNEKLTPYGDGLSDTDRAVCALISSGKFKNPPRNIKVEDDWKTHALVLDLIEANNIKIVEQEQPDEDYGKFYGLLALSTLNFFSADQINPNLSRYETIGDKQRRKIYEYQCRIRKARRFWSKAHTHPGVRNKRNRQFNPHMRRFNSVGPIKTYGELGLESGKFEELSSYIMPMEFCSN